MKRHLTATLLKACLLAEISKYRYMPAAAISTMRLSSQSKEVPCKIAYRGLETSVDTKPGDIVRVTADTETGTLTATTER